VSEDAADRVRRWCTPSTAPTQPFRPARVLVTLICRLGYFDLTEEALVVS
jgi:hypothetical protein